MAGLPGSVLRDRSEKSCDIPPLSKEGNLPDIRASKKASEITLLVQRKYLILAQSGYVSACAARTTKS
jgi:hypothetical protein